jgi:starch phosphorylase
LLDILEKEIIPMYYDRNGHGYPEKWVKMSKNSMKSLIPRYNAQRMLMDYVTRFYGPANRQQHILSERDAQPARDVAAWKRQIAEIWPRVTARRIETNITHIVSGETLLLETAVKLHGLAPQYISVECLVGSPSESSDFVVNSSHQLHPGETIGEETLYRLDLPPPMSGLQYYKIRLYPSHPLLSHRLEMGRMIWI